MGDRFRTLAAECRWEPVKTKGSRFLAVVAPSATRDEALNLLDRLRSEFADATHHCWAYRLGSDGAEFRYGDDGEPGGSAGRPIHQQLQAHDLTYVAAVVVRWFGGTKLGVGGLMRAYGGAAAEALDRATIREVLITRRLRVEHPYECSGAVQAVLAAADLVPRDSAYAETVRFRVDVPEALAEDFLRELNERTAGRALVEE